MRTWITLDGRRLTAAEMSDRHLWNTIRMLRRNVEPIRRALFMLARDADHYAENAPDGAADAARLCAQEARDMAINGGPFPGWAADLAFPIHAEMVAEFERRNPGHAAPRPVLGPVRPSPRLVDPDTFR